MKIAVFVTYLPPHLGGLESAVSDQLKALAATGATVTVVTSACSAQLGLEIRDGYEIRHIRAWNYFEKRFNAVYPIFSPSLLWYTYKAVRSADIVHAHDAFYLTTLVAAFWSKILDKPLVLTQHVAMIYHPNKGVRLIQSLVYATAGKFIFKASTQIIVLNSRVEQFLTTKNVNKSKITFLPNGIDMEKFSPVNNKQKLALRRKYNLPKNKKLALFVARPVPKKGFEKLLNLKSIGDLAFVFVGNSKVPIKPRDDHFFLGVISRDTISEIYKACDMFVLPSEDEGFPITIQEAMATGMPIITTDDPAYAPYHLNRKKMLFIEPSPETITRALQAIVPNYKRQQSMGSYSRNHALNNFTLDESITKLMNIYEKAIA